MVKSSICQTWHFTDIWFLPNQSKPRLKKRGFFVSTCQAFKQTPNNWPRIALKAILRHQIGLSSGLPMWLPLQRHIHPFKGQFWAFHWIYCGFAYALEFYFPPTINSGFYIKMWITLHQLMDTGFYIKIEVKRLFI